MKAARVLPPLLAGATLILLASNVVPASHRRQRLESEVQRLQRALATERHAAHRLEAEIDALRGDPFYLERLLVETWKSTPQGALPFDPYARAPDSDETLE